MTSNSTAEREEGVHGPIAAQLNKALSGTIAFGRKIYQMAKADAADAHDGIRTIYAIQFIIAIFLIAVLLF